jgi:hypothetical protein
MAATAPILSDQDEDPIALLVQKLRVRDGLTDREANVLRSAIERVETCQDGHVMAAAGQPLSTAPC